ncbi:Planctomycete cytochrome C [Stieleria bergensis]|uniref:Planctomycete cytochrome C n=1 Tax=Stieleria bergensis TaxID=2528025 RepID=A0A517SSZ9_9BACT|nr:Planctomycete cytochrome C [Planctomycetes bacterium SV_7m_r]
MFRIFCCLIVVAAAVLDASAVDFANDIQPILQEHCHDCHGADEQEGQLRLDRLSAMLAGGNSGEPAVVPGSPDKSYLLKLIRHQEPDKEMPPDDSLSEQQIELMEKWIASGAATPESYGPAEVELELKHWSFLPVKRIEANGIDDLIQRRLESNGLMASQPADRRTLIRRLYLVMHGLPPTTEQVKAFLSDKRSDAWPRLVDQVLASPNYGQRWATFWLDLARFGETHGFETNRERPNAWHYRDWVIEALNSDKPYDQFVREQLAGDALGEPIGTGFLVAGPYDLVKGQDPKLGLMQRMNELDDMINTTGTAFLGLTTGCARCHNHKFDPIQQTDYYALQAVFAGVRHGDRALPLRPEIQQRLVELDQQIETLKERLDPFVPVDQPAMLVIDEAEAQHLAKPEGTAKKPGHSSASFGDESYTWWKATAGKTPLVYRPKASGRYRLWLSWGAGHASHCQDSRYLIRSSSGDVEIANVNQQLDADGTGVVDNKSRWSGWYDAGVHQLSVDDQIILVAGDQGTAVTADSIVLQPQFVEEQTATPPSKRPAVNVTLNQERFPPRLASRVRFLIGQTNNGSQACLDELEIYSGDRNVALASEGATASSSGDFVHPLHKLPHINDGQHGNPRSWIVASNDQGWVQIDFAKPVEIDRIQWGRDRTGKISDRLAVEYRIETQIDKEPWSVLAGSADRYSDQRSGMQRQRYQFAGVEKALADQGRQWLAELEALTERRKELAKPVTVYAGTFAQPGATHRLYRGEPDAKRERVAPGGIDAFGAPELALDSAEQQRRLKLAQWIADPSHPLTARVIVNRLWQFHFGIGIVDTPSDFGINGARPTHPELLDWLANQLTSNGWSLKHIHRQILLSQTWQQDNRPHPDGLRVDAGTRLLWRFPPRRLEAEAIRDSILSVSGTLVTDDAEGPGFSPFEVQMENVRHYHAKKDYGPADWRRMVFMTRVRQEREHVFGVFDCPDASMVVPRRSRSTTPLQALNLLNSRFVMQQADHLAKRLQAASDHPSEQVQQAWHLCFQRPPSQQEVAESERFIESHGLQQFARAILNANEFIFIP